MEEERGFLIQCLDCGSTDIDFCEEVDYDWEERPIAIGNYIRCADCGNMREI